MPNRLAGETSPYLLQHTDNPVDWYPWGEEALGGRRAEDKPILLSIGYSACHWCHVMERESFEDAEIAALMNEHFVCIKVDREERPDLDAIYMEACQAMTGHGRLAADRLPDARAGAVLRRHLLPAGAAAGDAELPRRAGGGRRRPGTTSATRSARAAAAIAERLQGGARLRRLERAAATRRCSTRAVERACASQLRRRQRRLRRRAEVPARVGARVPARAAASATIVAAHAARDGRGRHLRPDRRRLRPLLGRRRTGSCPTSRRCSTTTPCSRARTCTAGR